MNQNSSKAPYWMTCLLLALVTLATFWYVRKCEFINLDDTALLLQNPHIQKGLTSAGVKWAFSAGLIFQSPHTDYWAPITWLSRMLDIQCFGFKASMHHLVNLFFHAVNTVLLFHLFFRMTGRLRRSAAVALLFAIHPLHVESVAWVIERKDVLSGLFWILTIHCYFRYAERHRWIWYGGVLLCMELGLMSKPMGVTLPFVLFLLDYWPLGRLRRTENSPSWRRLILEKCPLFLLVAFSCIITISSQGDYLEHDSSKVAFQNITVSYATYVMKTFIPLNLSIQYPNYGISPPIPQFLGSIALLGTITLGCLYFIRKHPYLIVGWLWFLGTLAPVVALNDLTGADRFTYVPLVGIFVMAAWGIPEWWSARRWNPRILWMGTVVVFVLLDIATVLQLRHWKDSQSLFEHSLKVTRNNHLSHANLGVVYMNQRKFDKALFHLNEAIRIHPRYAKAYAYLGKTCILMEKPEEAIQHYAQALRFESDNPDTWSSMGMALVKVGRTADAEDCFKRALEMDPDPDVYNSLGTTALRAEQMDVAREQFTMALRIDPDHVEANCNMGILLGLKGNPAEAIPYYERVLRVDPDHVMAHYNLGICLFQQGKLDQAVPHLTTVVNLKPDFGRAREALDMIRSQQNR